MRLLIKDSVIVNANETITGDILVEDGLIIRMAPDIEKPDHYTVVIDAKGLYAFPGGVDPHVHLQLPTPAGNSSDDFRSGSIAALAGGTTTIIDFVTPASHNQSLSEALKLRKQEAEASLIDHSFHMSITSFNAETENQIFRCITEEGINSFKTYLAYRNTIGIDYETLGKVMQVVGYHQGLVTVHCEDGDEISRLQHEFVMNGHTSPEYHALSRPNMVEADAVAEVLKRSEQSGCLAYLVHVSAKESIELIAAYKKNSVVFAETCPQYLMLDDANYCKPLTDSLKYVMSPPLRSQDSLDALWKHIGNGTVDVVATDHCPFNTKGQKDAGLNDFTKIPNGAGGIEYRLPLLYTYGVMQRKISLQRFVGLTSTHAAKIFGLYPQKGLIAEGSDADIVLWNPNTTSTISQTSQFQQCDSNIYEGIAVAGSPEYVICRGEIAFKSGKVFPDKLRGRFLKR